MITILNISDTKFSYNGIAYFKNFTPFVTGNKVSIVNTYDACISLTNFPTIYSDISVDGVTYGSVSALQNALLPVLFNRTFTQAGSLTAGYIPKATGSNTLGNSLIYDNGFNAIGIGTINPLNGGNASKWITLEGSAAYSGGIIGSINGVAKMYIYSESGFAKLQGASGEGVRLDVNGGTTALTALSNGNVGIGTTSPGDAKLKIGGASGPVTTPTYLQMDSSYASTASPTNQQLKFYLDKVSSTESYGFGTSSDAGLFYHSGGVGYGYHAFATSGTEKMRITSGGNVGIGTTSPGAKLDVNGDIYTNTRILSDTYGGYSGGDVTLTTNTGGGANLILKTSSNERMRITPSGVVCVGTTTPFDSGIVCSDGGTSFVPYTAKIGTTASSTQMFFRNPNGVVGSISTSGSLTSFNITSDYRLKQDFKPFNGLDLVSKIKVYDYAWKVDNSRMNGVIAHELQEVVPYAVTGEKDAKEMQQVDYSKLVPILVQAIQELKTEIQILKN